MRPPRGASWPETGRRRTETSTSPNVWSSSKATAQGWVSTVWASTWRPPDARRTHWPATNFHFEFSAPRSYFTVVVSPAAIAKVVVASSNTVTSASFMRLSVSSARCVSCRASSIRRLARFVRNDHGERAARATEEFLTFVSGAAISASRYIRTRDARAGRRGREESREGPARRSGGGALRRSHRVHGRGRVLPREPRVLRLRRARPHAAASRRPLRPDDTAQARARDARAHPDREGHRRRSRARARRRRRRLSRQALRRPGAARSHPGVVA